jgi:hypothetical protein
MMLVTSRLDNPRENTTLHAPPLAGPNSQLPASGKWDSGFAQQGSCLWRTGQPRGVKPANRLFTCNATLHDFDEGGVRVLCRCSRGVGPVDSRLSRYIDPRLRWRYGSQEYDQKSLPTQHVYTK